MNIQGSTLYGVDDSDIVDGVLTIPDYVDIIYHNFECFNNDLVKIILPSVRAIGSYFLYNNNSILEIDMPLVEIIGDDFMVMNRVMNRINMPNIVKIGGFFLFTHPNYEYTERIINSLKGPLYINGECCDKKTYIRKIRTEKLLK